MRTLLRHWTAALILASLAGCAPGLRAPTPAPAEDRAAEIVSLMQTSADAWNRGDLDGFLLPYLDSAETTFVGRSGLLRGKEAIRATYLRSYWKDGPPASTLAFRDIEVRPLGAEHALTVGHYLLTRPGAGTPLGEGIFSLVMVRTPAGWRILHDHSS